MNIYKVMQTYSKFEILCKHKCIYNVNCRIWTKYCKLTQSLQYFANKICICNFDKIVCMNIYKVMQTYSKFELLCKYKLYLQCKLHSISNLLKICNTLQIKYVLQFVMLHNKYCDKHERKIIANLIKVCNILQWKYAFAIVEKNTNKQSVANFATYYVKPPLQIMQRWYCRVILTEWCSNKFCIENT